MKKKVLISACLLGKNCRYDGGHSHIKELDELDVDWVLVCPEEAGGLGIPRSKAEMQNDSESILKGNGSIIDCNGKNVTQKFIQGTEESLAIGLTSGAECAVLKSRSPSCGVGEVYDGSFTHSLTNGDGIFAYSCRKSGLTCISSDDREKIKRTLTKQK